MLVVTIRNVLVQLAIQHYLLDQREMLQLVDLDLLVCLTDLKQPFLIFLDSDCEVMLRQQLRVDMRYLISLSEDVTSIEGLSINFGLEDVEQ